MVQSSLNQILKFDKIDFEKLEILEQKDFIGPGTFKPEMVNSIETDQERRNRFGPLNSTAFVKPYSSENFREKQVIKSLIGERLSTLENPSPTHYHTIKYKSIEERCSPGKDFESGGGSAVFKSDVIQNQHLIQ